MLLKNLLSVVFIFTGFIVNATKSQYDAVFLHHYQDSVVFNTKLNWYLRIKKDAFDFSYVRIDVTKQVKQRKINGKYILEIDPIKYQNYSNCIIGSTDTISNSRNGNENWSAYLSKIHNYTPELENYKKALTDSLTASKIYLSSIAFGIQNQELKLLVQCGYYQNKPMAFEQNIHTEIVNALKKRKAPITIENLEILFQGKIDADNHLDYIIKVNGYYFMYVSKFKNLNKQKAYTLVKVWKAEKVYEQLKYALNVLGEKTDTLCFDKTLNWYTIEIQSIKEHSNKKRRFRKIDLNNDFKIKQRQEAQKTVKNRTNEDSLIQETIYTYYLDSTFKNCSKLLIGTSDTLHSNFKTSPIVLDSPYYSYFLKPGDEFQIYEQWFKPCTPYIDFYVSGNFPNKFPFNREIDSNTIQINVNCDFDSPSYYQNSYLEVGYKSFTQNLSPMIEQFYKENSLYYGNNLFNTHLYYVGNIDQDYLNDFIINIGNNYFMFLTYKHDFEKQKVIHLETGFNDKNELFLEF